MGRPASAVSSVNGAAKSFTRFTRQPPPRGTLMFTPYAYAKLVYMRDKGNTEVAGFGITDADDLLLVKDFILVKQKAAYASVEFDDQGLANFMEEMVDLGYRPEQFMRIWIHTHPNMSARPSGTDEETFARVFDSSTWAVMYILSKSEDESCRIKFTAGPRWEQEIDTEIDYSCAFEGTDREAWDAEYRESVDRRYVQPARTTPSHSNAGFVGVDAHHHHYDSFPSAGAPGGSSEFRTTTAGHGPSRQEGSSAIIRNGNVSWQGPATNGHGGSTTAKQTAAKRVWVYDVAAGLWHPEGNTNILLTQKEYDDFKRLNAEASMGKAGLMPSHFVSTETKERKAAIEQQPRDNEMFLTDDVKRVRMNDLKQAKQIAAELDELDDVDSSVEDMSAVEIDFLSQLSGYSEESLRQIQSWIDRDELSGAIDEMDEVLDEYDAAIKHSENCDRVKRSIRSRGFSMLRDLTTHQTQLIAKALGLAEEEVALCHATLRSELERVDEEVAVAD